MTKVTSATGITLVTLQNCPPDIAFCGRVFTKISDLGVVVDMISLAPNHGSKMDVSFTINDDDLGEILEFIASLKEKAIKPIISGGNCKINVYDEKMKDTPGMAAKVFTAASSTSTDIRIITTSDVDISILVTEADFHEAFTAIDNACKE
ncbi:MAG: hypothetical protein U0N62_07030 [Hydrogeniiclostridium sp.]|nr:hypothetical protein [Clostridiales bacterium]